MAEKYIAFIKSKTEENNSSSKNFFIVIKYTINTAQNKQLETNTNKNIAINFLNESYFKIKESLSRCGNTVYDINSKNETEKILISFFNPNYKIEN